MENFNLLFFWFETSSFISIKQFHSTQNPARGPLLISTTFNPIFNCLFPHILDLFGIHFPTEEEVEENFEHAIWHIKKAIEKEKVVNLTEKKQLK